MLAQGLDYTADRGLTHIPGRAAPARKRPGCGVNHCVKVAPVDIRHFCPDRSVGWIDHIQRLRRFPALAVHEVVEASGDVGTAVAPLRGGRGQNWYWS